MECRIHSITVSLTHTHKRTDTLTHSFTHIHAHTLSFFYSLSHTHTLSACPDLFYPSLTLPHSIPQTCLSDVIQLSRQIALDLAESSMHEFPHLCTKIKDITTNSVRLLIRSEIIVIAH